MRLSAEYLTSLEAMTASYQAALAAGGPGSPSGLARDYLASRGIGPEMAASYRIGLVDGSHDEHQDYAGMIAIPYLTRLAGPVSFKFRRPHDCTENCQHAKYLGPYESRLYNTTAMDEADRRGYIAAVEGEINAMTLTYLCDIPAVGIPGAKMWQAHAEWRELFRGYGQVLLFPDVDKKDQAGEKLAHLMRRDIDTAKVIRLPSEFDANEAYLHIGADEIRRIAGIG